MTSVIGQPILRVEDSRLLKGEGRFLDDRNLPGQAYAAIVRSPHAHAEIEGIDASAARASSGVLGVFTWADLEADGVKALPPMTRDPRYEIRNRDGSRMPEPEHWALARRRVRHTGDPVALVLAESAAQAHDAASLVTVRYAERPAVVDVDEALAPSAAQLFDDVPRNTCFDWEAGDRRATEAALGQAAHLIRLTVDNNRLICVFMEPRGALAAVDSATGAITLYGSGQGAHRFRETLSFCLDVDPSIVRVVMGDVGGGFGPRGFFYPENLLVTWAARRLKRPVKWTGDRQESFLTDVQARGHRMRCTLALDGEHRFLGLSVSSHWNMGAYVTARGIMATIRHMAPIITGAYHFPAAHFELRGVLTNAAPAYAYRGIGRAEASHLLERLIDTAADSLGVDRIALRRKNLVPPSAMPYRNAVGADYDSGEFEATMDKALALADWRGFPQRRAEAEKRGKRRGMGVCVFVENAGGAPSEFAEVKVEGKGSLAVFAGSGPSGQGHETVFAQVLASELGEPFERVRVVMGDTQTVQAGSGTAASRSMRKAGTAIVVSTKLMLEKGKRLAGDMLEATPADIEYDRGRFRVVGTDRSVGLYEVAAHAESQGDELSGAVDHVQDVDTYPNGTQVAEVEVDPETGLVTLVNHVMVNDVGRVINPLIMHGQLHGGIVQGLGQVLTEHTAYDPQSGQLLSGSFMDYAIPRADEVPNFTTEFHEVPCAGNPLGVKGGGEGGTTGAPPAVLNAIIDALKAFGVRDFDMPATPSRVWAAIERARRAS
ncbi:MAG: xanthine dehydrogenase family protein molybdopterin-binding subunit [Alphaproteobacteria bacterium]